MEKVGLFKEGMVQRDLIVLKFNIIYVNGLVLD
jgi:hypothetical protein